MDQEGSRLGGLQRVPFNRMKIRVVQVEEQKKDRKFLKVSEDREQTRDTGTLYY